MSPKSAFIAITSKCNSRCIMCDFWKNKGVDLPLGVLTKLPTSLKSIDITGGEPFLRKDLVQVIKIIKNSCPKARLLITTNGLVPQVIKKTSLELVKIDKKIAVRVSLDGWGKIHDLIRGVPNAFEKTKASLLFLKKAGIKDLGVIFTLTKENAADFEKIVSFAKKENLEISVNLVSDSEIYFGRGHAKLRPNLMETKKVLALVKTFYGKKMSPKAWAKVWFYHKLLAYSQTGQRPISCWAGKNFFYLDARANVYSCHFKNWPLGNLINQSFEEIWSSEKRLKWSKSAKNCHACFMVCTAKNLFIF